MLLKQDVLSDMDLQAVAHEELGTFIQFWKNPQVEMGKVLRWKGHLDRNPKNRVQSTLEHTHAIKLLAASVLAGCRYMRLDELLVMTAFTVHDHGEGHLKRDVNFHKKTERDDLDELMAFDQSLEHILGVRTNSFIIGFYRRAFLLQFCRKNPANFPGWARDIMNELQRKRIKEAQIFDFIERFDYMLYGFEQFIAHGDAHLMHELCLHQAPILDELAEKLSGYQVSDFWTPKLSQACKEFVAKQAQS